MSYHRNHHQQSEVDIESGREDGNGNDKINNCGQDIEKYMTGTDKI